MDSLLIRSGRILPGFVADGSTLVDLELLLLLLQEQLLKGKIGCVQVKEANPGEVGLEWRLQASLLLPCTSSGTDRWRNRRDISVLFLHQHTCCSSCFQHRYLHLPRFKNLKWRFSVMLASC